METVRLPLATLRTEVAHLERTILATAGRPTEHDTLLAHTRALQQALRSPKVPAQLRAVYRTTTQQHAELSAAFESRYCHEALHRRIVEDAIRARMPVPPDVLDAYPDFPAALPASY